ncbi:MAG TPA: MarR family transcriptional regulator [Candidatus Dormibacteraeota bacterium]|nr:MarR family transcriptional regulator [Candidatus Dormibacteraeota bacterium]
MLKSVIMKIFTMKHFNIQADEHGLLYNVQVRQQMSAHVAPDAMPALEAFSALAFAARLMHRTMDAWADQFGLSGTRLGVLFMLRHQPEGVPLGLMATRLHFTPRNVTGLVDHLERDGLVTRVPDPADRRSVLARLTDQGRDRIDAVWEQAIRLQRDLLDGFTDKELAQLRDFCLRVVAKLEGQLPKCQPEFSNLEEHSAI